MVAKSPKATRYIEVLQAMSLPPSPAPIATGWSDSCRAGFAPAVGQRRQGAQENVDEGELGLTVCTCLNSESSPQLRFLVGDYTTYTTGKCACGRTHVRAVGSFSGRADDLINLRGNKMYPDQIEEAVRAVPGVGDEYEIVLTTNDNGLDIMTVRVEHADDVGDAVGNEVRNRCEVRVDVEVLVPGTLPKTEFKAKRVRDERAG